MSSPDTPSSAPSPEAVPDADAPVARAVDVADPSRVRRAPRYGGFGVVGFLAGALVALVLTFLPIGTDTLEPGTLFLLLLLATGTVGVFAGLAWALVADRRSLRRRGRD
ncbi:histidine kinase [Georgenia phoenicis]|uniref:histidine kinase n=1 Tax=unclassified Georgenia TaxID=2626815 RepID=UPI0039AFA529